MLFETFETWNFSNMSWGVAYLKFSDDTWNEMCHLKLFKLFNSSQELVIWNFQIRLEVRCAIWNFSIFSNPSWELLIWNFQMRLETRYSIWNVWNFKLFKHVMGVAYLKLSDKTWNEMCYLKLFKPIMGAAYLKLSDESWNKICYLKCLKLFDTWNF